jgi:2-C-methyl-D-erythritol 4-phosphate cytidylyltransferase
MNTTIILVAGGSGSRMAAAQPKQFLPVHGKAILHHTIEAFHRFDPTFQYLIVLPKEYLDFWKNHSEMKKIPVKQTLVEGGSERFFSVKNALQHVQGKGLVAIHDGVRPMVNKHTIRYCLETAREKGNAIPVLPVVDSLREVRGDQSYPMDRNRFRLVQTPQCFDVDLIKRAYQQEFDPLFTDDASVVEKLGIPIHLVEGNRENIKITTPFDLKLAEMLLS